MNIFVLAFAIRDNNNECFCEIVDRLFLSLESARKFAFQFIQEFKNGFLLEKNPPQSRGYVGCSEDEANELYFAENFTLEYSIQSFELGD